MCLFLCHVDGSGAEILGNSWGLLRSFWKFTNYDARQYIAEHFDRRPNFISHGATCFDDRSNECGGRSIGGKFPAGDIFIDSELRGASGICWVSGWPSTRRFRVGSNLLESALHSTPDFSRIWVYGFIRVKSVRKGQVISNLKISRRVNTHEQLQMQKRLVIV